MLTIHVWPRWVKEFLLTHPLYKSPTVDECLAFPFNGFAAAIGCCDVACRLAGNGGRRLFVEVGNGFNPEIGGESVVVDVEFAVLVANGGDSADAGG